MGNADMIVTDHVVDSTVDGGDRLDEPDLLNERHAGGVPRDIHLIRIVVEFHGVSVLFCFAEQNVVIAPLKRKPGRHGPAFLHELRVQMPSRRDMGGQGQDDFLV